MTQRIGKYQNTAEMHCGVSSHTGGKTATLPFSHNIISLTYHAHVTSSHLISSHSHHSPSSSMFPLTLEGITGKDQQSNLH